MSVDPVVGERIAARRLVVARSRARFGLFVFISMLAYSAQDLVLEPFAGAVFGFTPGDSTQLGGLQHGGVLIGMIAISILAWKARQGKYTSAWYTPVENVGLYWHVVDIIWIFLFPLMYLI